MYATRQLASAALYVTRIWPVIKVALCEKPRRSGLVSPLMTARATNAIKTFLHLSKVEHHMQQPDLNLIDIF